MKSLIAIYVGIMGLVIGTHLMTGHSTLGNVQYPDERTTFRIVYDA